MAYDPSKDESLFRSTESENGLVVEVKSYNKGPAKISFTRVSTYNNETKYAPVYRFELKDFEFFGQYWTQICSIITEHNIQHGHN